MTVETAAPLGSAGYVRIWLVGLFTGVVRWLEMLALGVLAYDLTGSPALVALLVILRFLPLALVGPVLGALADVLPAKALMVWGLAAMALLSAGMWALFRWGEPGYGAVAAAVLISGAFWAGDLPVRRKLMADLVGSGALARAVAVDGLASNGTRLVGPLAGGAVYQLVGTEGVFAISAVFYLAGLAAAAPLVAALGDAQGGAAAGAAAVGTGGEAGRGRRPGAAVRGGAARAAKARAGAARAAARARAEATRAEATGGWRVRSSAAGAAAVRGARGAGAAPERARGGGGDTVGAGARAGGATCGGGDAAGRPDQGGASAGATQGGGVGHDVPAGAGGPAAAGGGAREGAGVAAAARPMRGLLEAARVAWADGDARRILLVTIVFNVWGFPFLAMVPVLGREALELPASAIGGLTAIEGGFALLGSIAVTRLARLGGYRRLYWGATAVHLSAVGGIGLLGGLWPLAIGLAVAGFCAGLFAAMQSTLIWLVAPPGMGGRFLGLMTLCIGAGCLGFANVGITAELLGAETALKLLAVQGAIPLLLIARGWGALRRGGGMVQR